MQWAVSERVVVIAHSADRPSQAAWDVLLDEFRPSELEPDRLRGFLISSAGGAPDAIQREAITESERLNKLPTAVLSDSTLVRGAITVLSWFGRRIRGFPPDDTSGALDFLSVPAAQRDTVLSELASLQRLLERAGEDTST